MQLVQQLGFRLDDLGFESQEEIVFILQDVWTGTGTYPASCSMGIIVLSQGVKWPGCEVDYSPPSSAMFLNLWDTIQI